VVAAGTRLESGRTAPTTKSEEKTVRDKSDPSTRELILDSALKAFSQNGFDGASTRSIANDAGVNQGLIPYYFGSKETLWREAVDRAFESLHEAMGDLTQLKSDAPGREALAIWIRRYVAFVAAHPEFVLLMNEEGKRPGPRMAWIVERHVGPSLAFVGDMLKQGSIETDRLSHVNPAHFTYIFIGAVATIFHQAHECRAAMGYDPMQPSAVEAHADALVELFLRDARLG
jgi:TetR/AcrR family transcriptional regulator